MRLDPAHVILASRARSKRAILTELAESLASMDPDQVLEVVMARERLGSTGMGEGVALPHGRLANLDQPVLAVARHPEGVDFDAVDGKPVRIVVLLLAPEGDETASMLLLSRVARWLRRKDVREAILAAKSAEEIAALFDSLEQERMEAA